MYKKVMRTTLCILLLLLLTSGHSISFASELIINIEIDKFVETFEGNVFVYPDGVDPATALPGDNNVIFVGYDPDFGLDEGVIRFDLSEIHRNRTIESATLKFFVIDNQPNSFITIYGSYNNGWTEYDETIPSKDYLIVQEDRSYTYNTQVQYDVTDFIIQAPNNNKATFVISGPQSGIGYINFPDRSNVDPRYQAQHHKTHLVIEYQPAPPTGTVSINADEIYTNLNNVTLSLSANASGGPPIEMRFSNDNINWSHWEAYLSSKIWTLSSGDGEKTVYVQFKDGKGVVSVDEISDSIILDTTPPMGTISINGGAAYTNSTIVTLNIIGIDVNGPVEMRLSNDNIIWQPWEALVLTKEWTLSTGETEKTVYLQLRDAAENISNHQANITLDTTAPVGTIIIDDNEGETTTANVILSITGDDGVGVDDISMQFSNDGTNWSQWEPISAIYDWSLSDGYGMKTVYMRLKDGLGNISEVYSGITRYKSIPVPQNNTVYGKGNEILSFQIGDFLYDNGDGSPIEKIMITSLPVDGQLLLNNSSITVNQEILVEDIPLLTFLPADYWSGVTTFEWKCKDESNYATVSGEITINIAALSSNASLKSLSIDEGTFNPTFNKDLLSYTAVVENDVDRLTVYAEAEDTKAEVTGIGTKNLVIGINTIDITVTAEDGFTKRIYTIEVTRKLGKPTSAPIIYEVIPGDGQVSLKWNQAIGAEAYKVYSSNISGSYGGEIATVTGAVYQHTVTGLSNGIKYYFLVRGTNDGGDGEKSNEVSGIPRTTPSAPMKVTAVAGDGKATVTFELPLNDGGSPITSYIVTSSPDNITAAGAESPIIITGLTNNRAYSFKVKAINSAGVGWESTASNEVIPVSTSSRGGSGGSGSSSSIRLSNTSPNQGTVGSSYTYSLRATGGRSCYTFKVTSGELPEGLTLSKDGVISGTPIKAGTYQYTIAVTDRNGRIASHRFTQIIGKGVEGLLEEPLEEESTVKKQIRITIGKLDTTIDDENYLLDAKPFIDEKANRTLVPIRFISEALGAEVVWIPETEQVLIEEGGKEILLTIGSKEVVVNEEIILMDTEPRIMPPGRTFVPLRFVSEILGATVEYDEVTREITIIK